jgi:ATP-dependent Zn protease
MTQQQYSDEDLAYHEAGHAVAALVLGHSVVRVSIVRDDPIRGVRVPSLGNEELAEGSEAVHDRILIQLAGNAAQQVRNPGSPRQRDAKDWPRAEALAGSAEVLEVEWERAVALLKMPEHWQRVDRIAQALLREQVLEDTQIAELVDPPR